MGREINKEDEKRQNKYIRITLLDERWTVKQIPIEQSNKFQSTAQHYEISTPTWSTRRHIIIIRLHTVLL